MTDRERDVHELVRRDRVAAHELRQDSSSELRVFVGLPLEVTRDEAIELRVGAEVLERSSRERKPGWLSDYVRAHARVARVLRTMINRAQT